MQACLDHTPGAKSRSESAFPGQPLRAQDSRVRQGVPRAQPRRAARDHPRFFPRRNAVPVSRRGMRVDVAPKVGALTHETITVIWPGRRRKVLDHRLENLGVHFLGRENEKDDDRTGPTKKKKN